MSNRKENKVQPLFGVALKDSLQAGCYFVDQCIEYLLNTALSEVGLFRLCGSHVEISRLKEYVESDPHFTLEGDIIHAVTGLLKLYYREMLDPLMKFELYENWISTSSMPDTQMDLKKQTIKDLLITLPPENRFLLGKLCYFLKKVDERKEVNQMNSRNLAVCVGPNLVRSNTVDVTRIVKDSEIISNLVQLLIDDVVFYFGDIEPLNPFPKAFVLAFEHGEKRVRLTTNTTIPEILAKVAAVHKMDLNDYELIDKAGNLVAPETPLAEVPGLFVNLHKKATPKFTINFEHGQKNYFLNPTISLKSIITKVCLAHKIDMNEYEVFSNTGTKISVDTLLGDIPGNSVTFQKHTPPRPLVSAPARIFKSDEPKSPRAPQESEKKTAVSSQPFAFGKIKPKTPRVHSFSPDSFTDQEAISIGNKKHHRTFSETDGPGVANTERKNEKKFFTVHLPYNDFVNGNEQLLDLFKTFCKSRGLDVDEFETLDKVGNLVGFDTQLDNVVGGEVILKKKNHV